MDKLLIISNVRHKEIGDFIKQRGTFEVVGCYSSLCGNLVEIQGKILEVEKTLYLYQPEESGLNIRTEMQVFKNLISGSVFFKPGEVIFITKSTVECKKAEKYFISVMNSCGYKLYAVKEIDGTITFSNVYDNLLGITSPDNFRNSYKTLYRTERNSEDTVAYEGQDDSDLSIEPYSFQNLKDYETQKELVEKMSTDIEFRDDADQMQQRQISYANLGAMEVSNVLDVPQSIVLSGKSKSGLSTWASVLAVSASKTGKKVLVFDYTFNNDVSVHLKSDKIECTECRMKEILQNSYKPGEITICTFRNETEYDIRFNFIKHMYYKKMVQPFDLILIPTDYCDFRVMFGMLNSKISKVVLTVVPRVSDVLELLDYTDMIIGTEVIAIMNEAVKDNPYDTIMSQEVIKESLSAINAKVVSSVWFNTLDVGRNISDAII